MQQNTFFSVEQVIDRQSLTVTPDTPLAEAIALMQQRSNSCRVDSSENSADNSSCVLIVENNRLQGIFTERDLVKLIAADTDLAKVAIADVMSRDVVTLTHTGSEDIFTALDLLRQHRIRHLPIVDSENNLLGLTTVKNLRQKLQPINMMKWRQVAEVMKRGVFHASPDDSVRHVARLMAKHKISCVAIGETEVETDLVRPIGIITERDIVQFQNLNLDLEQPARELMSAPLFLVSPEDNLWSVNQQMQQHRVRRLLVGGKRGELLGIVTQTTLLQVFDPAEMYGVIESLQRQVCQLELERTESLERRRLELEAEVKKRTTALEYSNRQLQLEANLRQEEEQRYNSILSSLEDLVWSVEPDTLKVIYMNSAVKQIYQHSREEFYDNRHLWLEIVHPEDRDRVSNFVQTVLITGSEEIEYRIVRPDGEVRWLHDRARLIRNERDLPIRLDGIATDISDRKRREEILKDIASGMSVNTGENFLPSLVEYLSKTLQVDIVSISELIDSDKGIIRTLVVYEGDRIGENFEYPLAGAPCQNVINKQLCLYPEAIQELFPQDIYLQQIGAESYAGIPIFKSDGSVFGSIAILHSQPMKDIALVEEVLKIFASRLTSELERQQAELKLKQSEQKFRAIFDHTFQFIGLLEPDGKLIEANKTSLDFIGLSLSDVAGKPFWEAPWWSSSIKAQNLLQKGIEKAAKGEFVRFEVDHPGIDNRVVTVDFSLSPIKDKSGQVIMLIPEGRNISDLKQAEAKNREQAALLDVATDAIMVRGLNNQLLFWNKGAEKLYGWTRSEALNKNATELLYRTPLNKLREIQQAVRNNGEWQGELKQITKTGREITVESRWTLVKDEAGEPKSYLVVNTDITEQKQLEAQFLRTQRLESLGTLAGGIAHDLNNILAPILGFAKLLPLKLPDVDEQTKGFFKIMETNAQRGTALVEQILTFSRGLEGERGIVQIRHLIDEIGQIIDATFPKSIELTINAPKTLWTVNADINQLHQVLMNLCVNARDAMPNGGKLVIKAENFTVDGEYARLHLDAAEGNYVRITVTDTGVGIAPEIIDRIFEPFFTTKEIGRGTGLGLSTVIGIIKSHGGFIEVVSQTTGKRGTNVNVFISASDSTPAIAETEQSIPQGNGELILVVDDETPILEVTKAILETHNYRVLTAKDGIEAVASYANNQEAIALVIMDVMMPGMDGRTAIRILRQINPELNIIAISGLITGREMIAELDDDITAFMSKPCDNDELLRKIAEIVRG